MRGAQRLPSPPLPFSPSLLPPFLELPPSLPSSGSIPSSQVRSSSSSPLPPPSLPPLPPLLSPPPTPRSVLDSAAERARDRRGCHQVRPPLFAWCHSKAPATEVPPRFANKLLGRPPHNPNSSPPPSPGTTQPCPRSPTPIWLPSSPLSLPPPRWLQKDVPARHGPCLRAGRTLPNHHGRPPLAPDRPGAPPPVQPTARARHGKAGDPGFQALE